MWWQPLQAPNWTSIPYLMSIHTRLSLTIFTHSSDILRPDGLGLVCLVFFPMASMRSFYRIFIPIYIIQYTYVKRVMRHSTYLRNSEILLNQHFVLSILIVMHKQNTSFNRICIRVDDCWWYRSWLYVSSHTNCIQCAEHCAVELILRSFESRSRSFTFRNYSVIIIIIGKCRTKRIVRCSMWFSCKLIFRIKCVWHLNTIKRHLHSAMLH